MKENKMKQNFIIFLIVMFSFLSNFMLAGENEIENFKKIKSLAGNWQGKNPEGKPVLVTYEVVSNGSVVMERMETENEPAMITMFHLDGGRLMMTHYCSAMNQPRMQATEQGDNDNSIQFSLFDITNLNNPADGHMQKLKITFKDEDHIITQWTFVEDGKEKSTPFELKRINTNVKHER